MIIVWPPLGGLMMIKLHNANIIIEYDTLLGENVSYFRKVTWLLVWCNVIIMGEEGVCMFVWLYMQQIRYIFRDSSLYLFARPFRAGRLCFAWVYQLSQLASPFTRVDNQSQQSRKLSGEYVLLILDMLLILSGREIPKVSQQYWSTGSESFVRSRTHRLCN